VSCTANAAELLKAVSKKDFKGTLSGLGKLDRRDVNLQKEITLK
jgi:hypothetical protein